MWESNPRTKTSSAALPSLTICNLKNSSSRFPSNFLVL
nr:MAG TPA: hypothetical protein [Caudoviricetes sp.]